MRKLYAALASVVLGLACNATAQTAALGSFNSVATPIQSAPPDSIVQVTADAYGLALVDPADVPPVGTFWLVTSNGMPVPMPFALMDANQPIYAITDTAFLVDGTGGEVTTSPLLNSQMSMTASVTSSVDSLANSVADLIDQVQGNEVDQQMQMMVMSMDVPMPGGVGTNGGGGNINSFVSFNFDTNRLWLEVTNVANGRMNGLIHNSAPLVPYTIYSKQGLPMPAWSPETTFYGSGIVTNLTPFTLPTLERSKLLLRTCTPIAPRIIGAGIDHNVVIRRDGTVWAFGSGYSGQLGNGQSNSTNAPVQVTGLSNIVALATPPDGDFNLALDSIGKVWSWGAGDYGQLGHNDGLYANSSLAALVPGLSNIVAIAGGESHSLALKSDGTVWGWGDNSYGQLGDTNTYGRDYPARVSGLTNAIAIASGGDHCFALCANGTVWGWGYNEDGELGLGNTDDQALPVLVPALTNVVALSGGYYHSIALLTNGTVKAWGDDSFGETGVGSSSTPVTVSGLGNVITIACGGYHNLALDTNNNLFIWGNGWSDQLGASNGNNIATPFQLTSISNVVSIAGGESSSMISTADGSIYVWGSSGFGNFSAPSFVDLYTNFSSDNSGLPDWWQMRYFGHLGIDPSADPDGDGRSNLQEYQNGTNPTNFDTPPLPGGLVVAQASGSTNILITWNPSPWQVAHYDIYRYDYNYTNWQYGTAQQIGEVAGNVTNFTDNGSVSGGDANSVYVIKSLYPGGTSSFSAQAYVNSALPAALAPSQPITVNLVRNETGRWQLMFASLPLDVQTIQLNWTDGNRNTTSQNITTGSLTNEIYRIPDTDVIYVLGNSLSVQATATNGTTSAVVQVGTIPNDAPYFVDGRRHMKQNLNFLIRGASMSHLFFSESNTGGFGYGGQYNQTTTDFEEFSFLGHSSEAGTEDLYFFQLDNLWPFTANYDLANYLVDTTRTNLSYYGNTNFTFHLNFATNIPAPAILAQADPYWILQPGFGSYLAGSYGSPPDNWAVNAAGISTYIYTNASLSSGNHNLFGLAYDTGCIVAGSINGIWTDFINYYYPLYYSVLAPGNSVTIQPGYKIVDYANWCPAPNLQPVNYYFAKLVNPDGQPQWSPGVNLPGEFDPGEGFNYQPYPLPIDEDFAVTNQTPAVMFGAIGQPMILGAWAKYSIQGSSPTKFAYLGQYFVTNAFKMDANGNLTSTKTGVVSPYGELFPTEPGPVAMVTMPDIDTGLQATGKVQVISLALDANQDGTIDPTFNGQDFVSANRPYRFWTDQNFDRTNYDADDSAIYEDDVQTANNPGTSIAEPDCNYSNVLANGYSYRTIPTKRDLEDFTRLWICGLTTNALTALPTGSTVTLNWGDVGNPNTSNPTIDLFAAADADGGIGYQTNETVAAQQINTVQCPYIGRLAPGGSIQLNASQFNGWAGNHFIWCGVSTGTGKLNLTIADAHSNVLAQTSTYIQLVDIKQMYERWTVGDDLSQSPSASPYLAPNDLPAGMTRSFRFSQPGNTGMPYILFVHGWNMETWEKDRFAETAYKRLYWQGYQGRFGSFRWPTGFGFTGWQTIATNLTEKDNFDSSEYQAWQSAQGLLNKLNDLNSQYPGHVYLLGHSMGNIVANEALRLSGNSQVVNTYVASQAAVSAHTYDTNVANYSFNYPPWSLSADTPNIFGNWFAGNSGGGAGQVISFYNVNDFALSRPIWQHDELLKPDSDVLENSDLWWYGYNGSVSDLAPWNNFYKSDTNFTTLHFNIVTSLKNHYEVMGYAAQSWTTALGATAGVHHLSDSIDLSTIWLPDLVHPIHPFDEHFYHSAEFRGDNPQQQNYWSELLGSDAFDLK